MPKTSTSFKPGNNANPNGRPKKGYSITEMFKSMLSEKPEVKRILVESIYQKAVKDGDTTAQKMIWNYMDGLPKQSVDLTTGGKPFPLLGGLVDGVSSNDSSEETPETQQES